jgi:cephalosporin hydroxylase
VSETYTKDDLHELVARPSDDFQELFWKGPLISGETTWLGFPTIKSPLDLWIYQEIIHETKPEVIIETGTLAGGSALYLASVLDAVAAQDGQIEYADSHSRVFTIDINPYPGLPEHPRIVYYNGDSVDEKMVAKVHRVCAGKRAMVILDSDHSYRHVSAELRAYNDLVSPGCYLIVEDGWGPLGFGVAQAIEEFVPGSDFQIDRAREKLLMTFHPDGFLRRKEQP